MSYRKSKTICISFHNDQIFWIADIRLYILFFTFLYDLNVEFLFSYWLRKRIITNFEYFTPMIFLLQIASVFTSKIHNYRYLLVEPKITGEPYRAEYDIVMNKWYILSSLKMMKVMLSVQQRTKNVSIDLRNELKEKVFIRSVNIKRVELLERYLASVKMEQYPECYFELVKTSFLEIIENFPTFLAFNRILKNCKKEKQIQLEMVLYSYYTASYDICFTEYIYHKMQIKLMGKDHLLVVWQMLIRQIYYDTLCSFRFQTLPDKEEIRLDTIEANVHIKCIKSENFFSDTIDYINSIAKKKKRAIEFDIIFDISPYLILHLLKCTKKEPCKDISTHFSAKAVKAIMSYLEIDKDYNDLIESLPMSYIKSIDSIGSPRDLIDITNIIAFTSTSIKEYKECVKAVAAFGYVIGFYNNHLQTYCFRHKRVLCQTQKANTTRNYLHSAIFPFSGELLFLLPYKIKICEDLEISCIVGCEQSYTDLSNPIFRIINNINFFVKPFEQENIDDLVLSVCRFEFKTINEEKKLTLDFKQEVLSFEEKGKRTRAKEQGVKISKKQQTEESRSDNTLKQKNPVSTQSGAQVYAEKEEEIFDEEFFRKYLAQTGPKETYSTATKIRFENRLANEMLDAKIQAKINETSLVAMGPDEVEKEVLALLENELNRIIRIEKKAIVDYNMLAYISKKIEKMLTDKEVDACDIETIPKEEVGALCNASESSS